MACELNFVPKVDVCITNKCTGICIKELTDIVQLPYNETGWGSTTILTSDVVTATIELQNRTTFDPYLTFTVKDGDTDLYPNTTPVPFVLATNETWSEADGIFKLVYTIETNTTTYINGTQHKLFICNLQTCFNSLVTKILKECDEIKLAFLKDTLNQLEILIYAVKSAFSCGEFTTAEAHIAAAKIICDNICPCGCGGDC